MITIYKEKREEGYEWVDVINPTNAELTEIASKYGLHAALVEDCLQPDHLPKLEAVGDSHFIVLRTFNLSADKDADTIQEVTDKIAIFLGNTFIVSIHRPTFEFLSQIKSKYVDTGKCATPYHVLFRIFSHIVSTYDAPLAELVREIDLYEPKIFLQTKTPDLLKDLYYMKRRATVIDNIIDLSKSVHKNLNGKISTHSYSHLKDEFIRLQTTTEQVVDNVGNLLNIYISLSAQRTGEVMRVLTIFSVFFMPLTFIVGIYGMNFHTMPEFQWPFGYEIVWAVMIVVTVAIYFWFHRKRWM